MENHEILNLIKSNPDSYVQIIKAKHKNFYDKIKIDYIGEKFGEKLYRHINGNEVGKCKYCRKQTRFHSFLVGFVQYCSKKCANISSAPQRSKTTTENNKQNRHLYYETKKCLICENTFESLKYRNQKCCSAKCSGIYISKSPNRIKKIKKTKLEKYGNEKYVNSEKAKLTCLEKYGVNNISKTEYFKDVTRKESKLRFFNGLITHKMTKDVISLFTLDEYISTERCNKYRFQCKTCNGIFEDHLEDGHLPRCLICNPFDVGFSKEEKVLSEYVKSLVGFNNVVENDRKILNGLELDIYIPHKNIAIEYDGLHWHSENNGGKGKNYHLNKTELCNKQGIQLIHIFEDEWLNKQDIVKNKLKHILNESNKDGVIYARKCLIKEVDNCNIFLKNTHIQGECPSSIKLGAYYKDELVAVMTFGKRRLAMGKKSSLDGEYELLRFSSSKRIIGIASKLLSYFIKTYNPNKIITYADRRFSIGTLYEKIGFKQVGITSPNYWYFRIGGYKRWHRFNYRKDQLKNKLNKFDENLTEWENMKNNEYDRIWDCGNIKYEWIK